MNVSQAIREAAARLAPASDTARLDAELLMAHALGVSRSDLLLRHMQDEVPGGFEALAERRERHEPVAYIVGRQEFYGLDLAITPAVLIPRGDTETLIEAARASFAGSAPARILDLGTGSGALLLAALSVWCEAEGIGTDRDPQALAVAARNAESLGSRLERFGRAAFVHADWRQSGWSKSLGRFDLILCNPPYVEQDAELAPSVRDWEPGCALFAGAEGLDDYRILIPQLPQLLAEDGVAVLEIGAGQADVVAGIAQTAGFGAELRRDLAGRPRALVLRISLGKGA